MNSNNHTGTLYSFRTKNQEFWFHTTDHNLLKKIAIQGYIAVDHKVSIEGQEYTITNIGGEVLAMVGDDVNPNHHGEENPYSVQMLITIEPV